LSAVKVDRFLGAQPCVVHHREECDEPRTARLLGAHCVQQCSRLAWVDDASPVHLAGYLGRRPFECPDRVGVQKAELSRKTLTFVAGIIRRHRVSIGSLWRKLNPGRQALPVLAYLRKGETFAELAAGFGVGVTTAWR
jgi:hypothetical protein